MVETLDILSRPDSPLKLLLQTVEKNTALSKLSAEAADALNKVAVSLPVPAAVQKILPKSGLNVIGHDPIAQFEESFESYNAQVRDGGIDATLANIKTVHDQLESTGFLSGNCNPACLAALQSAKRDLAVVPEKVAKPIADMLSKAKDQGGNDLISDLDRQMKEVVTQPCRSLLTGRYPFTKNSPQDVLPADFAKLFKKTGILDDFFNNNLKNYVDVTVSNWTEMSSESPLGLSATALAQFQIASHIQGSFFSAGTTVPQLEFKLKPLELDERIGTFRLNIEGQELVYRHGPEQTTNFKWPGIASNVGVRVVFETLEGKQFSRQKEGAWALFRLFDEANMLATNLPEKYILTISLEGYQARFELEAASVDNPFAMNDFQRFRCPETLRR